MPGSSRGKLPAITVDSGNTGHPTVVETVADWVENSAPRNWGGNFIIYTDRPIWDCSPKISATAKKQLKAFL